MEGLERVEVFSRHDVELRVQVERVIKSTKASDHYSIGEIGECRFHVLYPKFSL